MPQVTSLAPDFTAEAVIGSEFKSLKLSDYRGKWVVLFFYPLDFTFVCPTEIVEYDAKLDEFKKIGAEVIGVSIDSKFSHLAWKQKARKEGGIGDIKYPLVADITKQISRDGKEKSVKATLQERKNTARAFAFTTPDGSYKRFSMPEVRGFGNTAPHLYNEDRYNDLFNSFPRQKKLGLKVQDTEDGNGVKVLEVEENSASATAGLQKDDIVTEIGGIKVTNTDEVREQLMENHDKNTYNIKARRNGKEMSFDIKIPKKLKTVNL